MVDELINELVNDGGLFGKSFTMIPRLEANHYGSCLFNVVQSSQFIAVDHVSIMFHPFTVRRSPVVVGGVFSNVVIKLHGQLIDPEKSLVYHYLP